MVVKEYTLAPDTCNCVIAFIRDEDTGVETLNYIEYKCIHHLTLTDEEVFHAALAEMQLKNSIWRALYREGNTTPYEEFEWEFEDLGDRKKRKLKVKIKGRPQVEVQAIIDDAMATDAGKWFLENVDDIEFDTS
jgi:hypothetical protein